ncbi:MAG: hypothetical protein L0I93_04325 [Atopostipes suicloacalis]|nr:hypothetical protein [Atopostipes suicloacalis]
MKNKFQQILFLGFSLLLLLAGCGEDKKEATFNQYKSSFEEQNYKEMYSLLSKDSKNSISKEDFVDRYQLIYDAIEAANIEITADEIDKDSEEINFQLSMDTFIKELTFDQYQLQLIEEEQDGEESYFVDWDESLIFPQMEAEDEVRIETSSAKRGEIFDKEGQGLALNGLRYQIGIHPERFDEGEVSNMAALLDIDSETIQEALDENTNPAHFVPIVTVAVEEETLINDLLAIDGVLSKEIEDRIYPGGEAFGALIGYINPITAEELDAAEEGFYHSTSLIGKAGLESVYETELRAEDGKEIYISKIEDGEEVERISLAKMAAKDGEDIQLTIDSSLQEKIYDETKEEVGTTTAIHPLTGDVLALVSYPSYDPNLYRTYTPNRLREKWEKMEASAFENRFNNTYSPGSAFKLITAAIGLEEGAIKADEALEIEGKSWQKDASWGDYQVNRVSQNPTTVDLRNAFVYSDNIYFAQKALEIGADSFVEGAKRFGFAEELPFDYPFTSSQIANENEINNEILLADTGYGQGELLMSSLHLASVYSSLVNDGKMMQPMLIKEEVEVWKEALYSENNRQILLDNLVAVIENEQGTGSEAKIDGVKLAGKTGTAEFKQSQADSGKENGWFVAMNVDEPEIVLSMMIENVEDKGGSQYPLEKVRNVLIDYFEKNSE